MLTRPTKEPASNAMAAARPGWPEQQYFVFRYSSDMQNDRQSMPPDAPEKNPFIRLDPRKVAAAASILAVASLATLVTVVSLSGSGTLAAVALILAILAFIIQIVVFITDLYIGSLRDLEAKSVYADTKSLLTKIETGTAATSDMVQVQLSKLIDGLLIATKSPVSGGEATVGPADQVQGALIAARNTAAPQFDHDREQEAARVTILTNWLSAYSLQQLIADGVKELPSNCFPLFDILGMDVVDSYQRGLPEGRVMDMPMYYEASIALQTGGFARQEDAHLVLTHKGLLAASLIKAPDPIPEYIVNLWPEIGAIRGRSQH